MKRGEASVTGLHLHLCPERAADTSETLYFKVKAADTLTNVVCSLKNHDENGFSTGFFRWTSWTTNQHICATMATNFLPPAQRTNAPVPPRDPAIPGRGLVCRACLHVLTLRSKKSPLYPPLPSASTNQHLRPPGLVPTHFLQHSKKGNIQFSKYKIK